MRTFVSAYPSAARTASPADAVISVPTKASACTVYINVTAVTLTPSVVFNIRGRVPGNSTEYLILASAAVTAVSVTRLEIGPAFPTAANASESENLPFELVIDPVHGDADSITYTVSVLFS